VLLQSTTQTANWQQGSSSASRTGIGRVAGVYVSGSGTPSGNAELDGLLAISAGRNLNAKADIGDNLRIESLQDSASYTENQTSAGASVTVGAGGGGNANFSRSRINSVYANVAEQSGLKAATAASRCRAVPTPSAAHSSPAATSTTRPATAREVASRK
jgi:hypothetical protein